MTSVRRGTPFFERSARSSSHHRLCEWSSLLLVDVFTTVEDELRAMRTAVSMNDMSPLSKTEVRGPDAVRAIDRLVTKDTSGMAVGQVMYTPWCREDGKVVNDGLVFRTAEDTFRISSDPQLAWLSHVTDGLSVDLEDVTGDWGILALQGPRSREVLERASADDWSNLPFSRRRESRIGDGVHVDVSRQGFTGELGYELWVRSDDGAALWDAIADAGRELGIQPAGATAVDVARVEAGLLVISADYTGAGPDHHGISYVEGHESSPFGLGMGYLVDLDGRDFVGRDALVAELEAGSPEALVGLELDWREVAQLYHAQDRPACVRAAPHWVPLDVTANGRRIGRATSVTWSPTTHKLIGFGVVERAFARSGSRLTVEWELDDVGGPVAAAVRELPFVPRRRA